MACCLGTPAEPVMKPDLNYERPLVRMCASGSHTGFPNFVDVGDTVVLFVDFGNNLQPMKYTPDHPVGGFTAGHAWPDQRHQGATEQYEVKLAGLQAFLKRINPKHRNCKSFKTEATILMTDDILDNPGGLVKFIVPYCDNRGKYLGSVTEKDITKENHKVYCHALWNELVGYNKDVRDEIQDRTSSKLGDTTYGSIRRTNRSSLHTDEQDGAGTSRSVPRLTSEEQTPLQVNYQPRPKRLWPDSWEMSYWRNCCDPCLRSNNCFARFWAMFFVAPLTNVTGLSLYYQLYLSEIFHTRFWTRLGHYLCMPLIVMMMLSFFAQWRFYGCYTLIDTEVLILNGAFVLAGLLMLWYFVWGIVQAAYLMGLFMMVPMAVLYILANIIFQLSVKNAPVEISYSCDACWNHTVYFNGAVQYYSSFKLMPWYFNPILWVCVLCFGQALSHIFEPTIPPRVNQTAHWLSCGDMLKRHGCTRTLLILCAQAVFGTVDELLASPRLLPLFILRVCFTLGYRPKEWKVLKLLVEKSIEFGDPALDYIGTGGAGYLPENSLIPEDSVRSIKDLQPTAHPSSKIGVRIGDPALDYIGTGGAEYLPENSLIPEDSVRSIKDLQRTAHPSYQNGDIGVRIGELRTQLRELELTLTDDQKAILQDPLLLRSYEEVSPALEQYIVLRHYVAKYELQLHAYGPFRTTRDEEEVLLDNRRMERDFSCERHGSFQNFLKQVRFYLWMMEDDMIERRALSACCDKEL